MINERPKNQMVNVTFYKESGKYYTNGLLVTNHFLFEEEFKQDLINTQSAMGDGWQEHGYYVVTSCPKEVNGFYEALFQPNAFKGIVKTK